MTQKAFGALTGAHETIISRRERDELGTKGATATLYELIYLLNSRGGMEDDVRSRLESVPLDQRGEERALVLLILLAVEKGQLALVRRLLGDASGVEEEDESMDRSVGFTLDIAGDIKRALLRRSKRTNPIASRFLDDAAADFERGMHQIRRALEAETEQQEDTE